LIAVSIIDPRISLNLALQLVHRILLKKDIIAGEERENVTNFHHHCLVTEIFRRQFQKFNCLRIIYIGLK